MRKHKTEGLEDKEKVYEKVKAEFQKMKSKMVAANAVWYEAEAALKEEVVKNVGREGALLKAEEQAIQEEMVKRLEIAGVPKAVASEYVASTESVKELKERVAAKAAPEAAGSAE